MLRRTLLATLCGFSLAFASPASAQQPFSAEQRSALEALVRDILMKNPEIIQDALVELEKRQQQAQVDAQKQVLVTEREALISSPHSPVVGNPQGDVTVVEFFDYNCGFCKRSLSDTQKLLGEDRKLRVVLKDFPVLGADSVEAARVAVAVKKQIGGGDKYFAFHAALMGTRGRVNGARALEVAAQHGANLDRVRQDMESMETRGIIEQNVVLGDRLGLTGTPAFIVGDEIVFGAVGADQMRTRIAAMRQCGKTAC
jgi:protein-disulfide isomerase